MPSGAWSHKILIGGVLACCLARGLALAQQAGEWRLDDSDGEIRVGYFDKSAAQPDADPLLSFSCDSLNASLTGFYRTRTPSVVEAAQAGNLALQLTAPQAKAAIPAYATQAPGEDAVGFQAPFTADLAAVLGASDLVLDLADLSVRVDATGVQALTKLAASCPQAAALSAGDMKQFRTYVDAGSGFVVDIPVRMFRLVAADRNGRRYRSEAGAADLTLGIYNNALEQNVGAAYAAALADRTIVAAPSYKAKGKDFFVISGKAKGRIVYYKSLLTCNASVWASLRLEYDESSKQDFDAVLTRMSQSFTPRIAADGTALCE
ncbi:MAG: hypothetical protein Q8K85_00985 [Hyphomicrobium sp.]|nr:hypothetical protein [Hyphomicrobium sp.]